jgi:hypothetical protein
MAGDDPLLPHYLGSGDYHYVSYLRMKQLQESFALILLDHHPDDQPGAFDEGMLSCGNWVATARRELSLLRCDVWIRGFSDLSAALTTLSAFPQLPLFLSIDLDVLSPAEFRTDWDQGEMLFSQLKEVLQTLCRGRRILGVDICGAAPCHNGAALSCDAAHNSALLDQLDSFLVESGTISFRSCE